SVADPTSLPFAANTFPAIWAVQSLEGLTAEEADDVVRELERVAEPGAPIAVVLP
ncbi:class I SAM-dependent methyltransferase, partial [Arthrobacter globiformis]